MSAQGSNISSGPIRSKRGAPKLKFAALQPNLRSRPNAWGRTIVPMNTDGDSQYKSRASFFSTALQNTSTKYDRAVTFSVEWHLVTVLRLRRPCSSAPNQSGPTRIEAGGYGPSHWRGPVYERASLKSHPCRHPRNISYPLPERWPPEGRWAIAAVL